MPMYDFENLVRAWAKSAFGLFVGFAVFYAFNSAFLGVLAAAFFFFIPISEPRLERLTNGIIFGGVMLFILFWAFGMVGIGLGLDLGISTGMSALGVILFLGVVGLGVTAGITRRSIFAIGALGALVFAFVVLQPWTWNTSAIIFVAVWLVGFAAGIAGDIQTRPGIGAFVLFVCFIIFTAGVGSQDVGVAFFGEWWPTIYNSASSVLTPLGNAWSQISGTVGDAWMLMTNPVGYATRLMNGSYAPNPIGQTGAYGVELTSFEVTPILIEQPFMITTNTKNSGGYDAEKVSVTITSGSNAPLPSGSILDKTSTQRITIKDIGIDISKCAADKTDYTCTYLFDGKSDNKFTRQNIWQTYYSGKITCDVTAKYQIRKKYIPINITLRYDYTTDSSLGKGVDKLEFISQAEWDRLAKLDKIQLKDVQSEYTSGPVKFPIGTPGLKSPIREDQDFHIGLSLLSVQKGGRIESVQSVELNYPKDFVVDNCVPEAHPECSPETCKVVWKIPSGSGGDKYFYCHVNALKQPNSQSKLGTSPTKSYVIIAKAKYTYTVSQDKVMKVDFGSWCCAEETDSCAKGSECCSEGPDPTKGKGVCVPTGACKGGQGSTTQPTDSCTAISVSECPKYPECVVNEISGNFYCMKKT